MVGYWRILHNEELHNLHSSPYISRVIQTRKIRWARHVTRVGEMRNAYKILVGQPEGKRPLGRHERRCKYKIRMDIREIGWEDANWIHLVP
jgi:hypothetical protein